MLVWLDILTPKQLLFLGELGKRLEGRGYEVFRTTRQYREVNELLKARDVNAVVVGKHGGASLEGKLAASARRVEELAHIIGRLKPRLSFAFASPEAARTAYGLGIPHYTANDSPHSEAVARLTIPLAERLFSPAIIPLKAWLRLGARPRQVIRYNGLDPIAWLKSSAPTRRVLDELGIDDARPVIVFRVEESFASYLLGRAQTQSVIVPVVNALVESQGNDIQIVVLPRYAEQMQAARSIFHGNVHVPRTAVNGPNLLFFTSLFIGAGGTMTAEAALLGTPTISCYPGPTTYVERYLIREKLISRVTEPEKVVKRAEQILENLSEERKLQRERATALVARMEDPAEAIARYIEKAYPP